MWIVQGGNGSPDSTPSDLLHIGQVAKKMVLDEVPRFPEDAEFGCFLRSGRPAVQHEPRCADAAGKGTGDQDGNHQGHQKDSDCPTCSHRSIHAFDKNIGGLAPALVSIVPQILGTLSDAGHSSQIACALNARIILENWYQSKQARDDGKGGKS